jgi:hypothetical protein
VGGGSNNVASDAFATVGGGVNNVASGYASTIGGGWDNSAYYRATVSGGNQNQASADGSTIPGGVGNSASGKYSLAAGLRAKANHDGTFVWADATDTDFASIAKNEFAVRASGGVRFVTGGAGATIDGDLRVAGNYIQFPTIAGSAPAAADCNEASEAGRIVVRTDGTVNLYICLGVMGWVGK